MFFLSENAFFASHGIYMDKKQDVSRGAFSCLVVPVLSTRRDKETLSMKFRIILNYDTCSMGGLQDKLELPLPQQVVEVHDPREMAVLTYYR